ncbi:hypothetical protein FJY68_01240 [candidate division WOR-3 bacterium]|uniref:Uncharacterized protein n=1 Tax=candidate division WOR-3 bacterium TaxID=2052148 RepID=A0A937XCG7_UNCW3|nr:hypothetical protein [candidate division WOR-3 bacterium]
MLHEFAVDPEVLRTEDALLRYVDCFGANTGRLIARFPNDWTRRIYELHPAGRRSGPRIEILLGKLKHRMWRGEGRSYDGQGTWLEKAEAQHEVKAFQAILAKANPRDNPDILLADSLCEEDDLWSVSTDCLVERTPDAISKALAPIMKNARSYVMIVEPYFAPDECGRMSLS